MAWYVHAHFSEHLRKQPRFALEDPIPLSDYDAPGMPPSWRTQVRTAVRVDPLPRLVGIRSEDSAPDALPDFLAIASQYVASSRFKEIVETLEPGRHQFIPITLRNSRVTPTDETVYWIVNVLKPIKAVLDGPAIARLRELGRIPALQEAKENLGRNYAFVDRAAVSGCHLWRSYVGFTTDLYFSEELMRRIREADLDGITPWRAVEVDTSDAAVELKGSYPAS